MAGLTAKAFGGLREHPIDWLIAMLVSWFVPLGFFGRPATYFASLW